MKLLKMQQLDDDEDELAYTSTTSTKGGAGQLAIQKSFPLTLLQWSLFVFSIDDPKQNATTLLTTVSNIVFYALSSGTRQENKE